jgi:ATP synthase protein I
MEIVHFCTNSAYHAVMAPAEDPKPRTDEQDMLASWYRMTGVGVEFIIAVLLFGGLGWLADRWLGTRPWLMLTGGALGFAGGLWLLIKMARRSFRQ